MVIGYEKDHRRRRFHHVGRIGLAFMGGGLFAFLAWEPNPPGVDRHGSADDASKRKPRRGREGRAPNSERAVPPEFTHDARGWAPGNQPGAAVNDVRRTRVPARDAIRIAPPTAPRNGLLDTTAPDGDMSATPIRNSRGPP